MQTHREIAGVSIKISAICNECARFEIEPWRQHQTQAQWQRTAVGRCGLGGKIWMGGKVALGGR